MNNIDLSDLPPEVLNSVTPERRRELEEYAQHRGTTLTRNQEEKWDKEVSKIPFDWNNPPTKPSADDEEINKEAARIYFLKPKTPAEFVYFKNVQLNLEQEARQHQENESNRTIALIAPDKTIKPEICITANYREVYCNAEGHRFATEKCKRARQMPSRLQILLIPQQNLWVTSGSGNLPSV